MARDCRAARFACSLQLDGELPMRGGERLAQHLSCCGGCRSFARELEAISSWLRVGQQKEIADVNSS
jgi:predicted anti-sigma-YlaC factor YlaD